MRLKYSVLTGLAILALGASAYAGMKTLNVGFGAPAINGENNIPAPETGAIFLDTSVNPPLFKGNAGTPAVPAWKPLSASATSFPPGMVIMTAATQCPSGTLEANGASLVRDDHQPLFEAIDITYGSVDSDHFNLPNTSGVFIRGEGSQTVGSVTYTGTQAATTQADQFQGHYHNVGLSSPYSLYNRGFSMTPNAGGTGAFVYDGAGTAVTITATTVADGTNGTARPGNETRPANIVLKYCIVE